MFIRKDLPIEQIIVQSTHAGIELTRQGFIKEHYDHPNLVIIGVKSEKELHKALHKIQSCDVKCVSFKEPDINNEITAFATEPILADRRHIFRHYNCLKLKDNNENK